MRLGAALPFPDFKERFDTQQQTRLWDILRVGHKQIITSASETEKVYRRRNGYIVNQSDLCDSSLRQPLYHLQRNQHGGQLTL